ncbi:MAG: hypothetical protein V1874_01615 [Spirochaetota bacterium]
MIKKIKKFKLILIFLPFLFTGFISTENNKHIEYYNNFRTLKESGAPRELKVVKTDNAGKGKSLIEKGILVTHKNRNTNNVQIAGDFSNWMPVDMSKGNYGIWYYFINEFNDNNNNNTIRYKFVVDGIWLPDPMNPEKEDDDSGSYVSIIYPINLTDTKNVSYRLIDTQLVEFRIYKPRAKHISLVGDFNNWNPENDLLKKKKSGVWMLVKRLNPGIYKYKYIIDGERSVDIYNSSNAGDIAEGICSLIKIEK